MIKRKIHFSAVSGLAGSGGLWPVSAVAGEGGGVAAATHLTQLIGGLALVILAIVALGWVLRRTQRGLGRGGSQAIELLAMRSVGTRERLVLVQVGEEQVLVGVAPSGIRTLHTLQTPLRIEPAAGPDFSSALRRAVGRPASREDQPS